MGVRVLYTLLFLGSVALADDAADRAKLAGTWQSDQNATWMLENTSDAMKITQTLNGQKVSEIECNVTGKECEVTENGHKAKVSMWFNGPKLVELETKGSEVIKRTFALAGPQDAMEVVVVQVVPSGKTETSNFHRAPVSSAQR
jgi:hypothetical protein